MRCSVYWTLSLQSLPSKGGWPDQDPLGENVREGIDEKETDCVRDVECI